jgi:NAD(P)-dependent dehydrogenase (short-subunit alcohol dehydrogenase family)
MSNASLDALFGLQGEVAVVTGAGRGIGEGIAKTLAGAGAAVVCAARRTHEIERVAGEIVAAGGRAIAVTTDVTDEAAVAHLAQRAIAEWGQLNIWVNNAGGSPLQMPLTELPRAEWDATIALNLTAIWSCCRVAASNMADGGRIVNISSIAAEVLIPGSGHYGAAKAGTNMLTRIFAMELGPRIRVNCIMPGAVPTEIMMGAMKLTEADLPRLEKMLRLPAGRLGTPEDLGAAALYLCSPASAWVTGQCIRISGGP